MMQKSNGGIELPRVRHLADLCRGKRVAIVGSATPDEDMSAQIDACDLVIRMNNFYNMGSGRVGRKTDVVVLTPSGAWQKLSDKDKGEDVIREQHPLVFSIRYPERLLDPKVQSFFHGCEFARDDGARPSVQRFTTGTVALSRVAEYAENCTVLTAGYNPRAEFLAYLEREGRHYLSQAHIECVAREKYLEICAAKTIEKPQTKLAFRAVIPARKGSSLKDKNIRLFRGKPLLVRAIETAREAFPNEEPPIVLTDSEVYARLAREAGAEIPYIDREVKDDDNVVLQLRRWRDYAKYYGLVAMIQCTSPTTRIETLQKIRAQASEFGLRAGLAVITATPVRHKSTAYFARDIKTGAVRQLFREISPSVPRQSIPEALRFTGAVSLVHSDALNDDELFHGVEWRVVDVPAEEARDIDAAEDFEN